MKGTKYCGCSALDKDCGQAEGRGELVCSQNNTESVGTTSCRSVVRDTGSGQLYNCVPPQLFRGVDR